MNPTDEQIAITERFEQRLEVQPSGCIEYKGPHLFSGYGTFNYSGKKTLAHRFAWELWKGPIPAGMWVLHKCDNPPCCNIDHLFLGTCQDNTDDRINKGRDANRSGQNNGRALLNEDDVRKIHTLLREGLTSVEVASRYSVTADTIRSLKSGFSWKHIYAEFNHAAN